MRLHRLVTGSIVAIAVATGVGSATVRAERKTIPAAKQVAAAGEKNAVAVSSFATLKGVKAEPMAAKELDAVKGQHVHFLDAAGGFHLAGNLDHMNNWQDLGGGEAVAPSYHGICVAAGLSGPGAGKISIPGSGAPGFAECP